MVQAFSLTSNSLAYFIGYTLVHARRVAIVSPWMSDVELKFPVTNALEERTLRLSEALRQLPETEVMIIVKEGESHNDYLRRRLPDHVTLIELDDLHAKAVICDEYVYLGSANITRGGFSLNRELCEVIENDYENIEAYLESELDIYCSDF